MVHIFVNFNICSFFTYYDAICCAGLGSDGLYEKTTNHDVVDICEFCVLCLLPIVK